MFFGGNTGNLYIEALVSNDTIEKKLKKLFERKIPNDDFEDEAVEGFDYEGDSSYVVGTKEEGILHINVKRNINDEFTKLMFYGNLDEFDNSLEKIKKIEQEFGGITNFYNRSNETYYNNDVAGIQYSETEEKEKIIKETMESSMKKLKKEFQKAGFDINFDDIEQTLTKEIMESLDYTPPSLKM